MPKAKILPLPTAPNWFQTAWVIRAGKGGRTDDYLDCFRYGVDDLGIEFSPGTNREAYFRKLLVPVRRKAAELAAGQRDRDTEIVVVAVGDYAV